MKIDFYKCLMFIAIIVFLAATTLRGQVILQTYGFPLLDESLYVYPALEIVSGASFLLNDYAHGTIYQYSLAVIFKIYSMITGISPYKLTELSFFSPEIPFLLNRLLAHACVLAMAGVVFFWGKKIFSKEAALIGAILCLLPYSESLVYWKSKASIMIPLWQVLTLFALIRLSERNLWRDNLAAATFCAFAAATKPLLGGVIVFMILPAKIVWAHQQHKLGQPLLRNMFDRKFWYATGLGLVVFSILFPSAILHPLDFINEHSRQITVSEKSSDLYGYDLGFFVTHFGWSLSVIMALSLSYLIIKGCRSERLLCAYPLIFLGLIAFQNVEINFYLNLLPASFLAIGIFFTKRLEDINSLTLRLAAVVTLFIAAGAFTYSAPFISGTVHSDQKKAQAYINENVPNGSAICVTMLYHDSPRLFGREPKSLAGQMRVPDSSQFLIKSFYEAHQKKLETPDARSYQLAYVPRHFKKSLLNAIQNFCREENSAAYVILRNPGRGLPEGLFSEVNRFGNIFVAKF